MEMSRWIRLHEIIYTIQTHINVYMIRIIKIILHELLRLPTHDWLVRSITTEVLEKLLVEKNHIIFTIRSNRIN